MTSNEAPKDSTPSLAARLRKRFGADVDPQVELASDPSSEGEPAGLSSQSPSSTVIGRLSTRGAAATRYQLRGEIARGGMGAILEVFDEDLRRRLAMKVILEREGAHDARTVDPTLLARFLEEAQVTGQLDHPGIVPVHELGLDAEGRVYFTMRLVHGRNLEAIFGLVETEAEGWSTTRALGVLLKVCEAMAYAHAKGVIHRDLKPSNVMVGRFGEVYVMDWGLARIQGHVDRHDLRVRDERDTGRPAPRPQGVESAARDSSRSASNAPSRRGSKAGSSTAADEGADPATQPLPRVETDRREASRRSEGDELYTMDGDVLGTPSYMAPEQARGKLDALDERTDVYAVGAMLYRLLSGTAPYAQRGEKPGAALVLERALAGPPEALESLSADAPAELVAISSKAMAREPAQRYADMLALGEDLRAFLEGRVVQAFEAGALAEARKWVRRNRSLSAALAATVLALIGGLVASLVFADRARASAVLAEERRMQATASATLAESRRVEAGASAEAAQRQARIAEEANAFLNNDLLASIAPEDQGADVTVRAVLDQAALRLAGRFGSEPAVEAALQMTIGTSFERLGEFEIARQHLERALELNKSTSGPRSESTLKSMRAVASVWGELGRNAESIALYREALGLAQDLLGPEQEGTLSTMSDLAIILEHLGQFDEARELYEAALPIQERVFGGEAPDTLATANNLALLDQEQGRYDESERRFREILERRRRTSGERHPETLIVMSNLAVLLSEMGKLDESEALSREALGVRRELYAIDHPMIAREIANLATFLERRGKHAEALELSQEALRIYRQRYGEDSEHTLKAKANVSIASEDSVPREEVLALKREVLEGRRRVLGAEHPDTLESMNAVATTLKQLSRFDEAEPLYRETLDLQRKVQGDDHPVTLMTLENLGGLLYSKKDYAGSEEIVRAVLEGRKRVLGEKHPDVAKTTFNLGLITKAKGDKDAALALLESALALTRESVGKVHQQIVECCRAIGDLEFEATRHVEALASYVEALEVSRALHPDDGTVGYLLHQIGALQLKLEDNAAALTTLEEAVALRERLHGPDTFATRISLFQEGRALLASERYADAERLALDFLERTERDVGRKHDHMTLGRELLVKIYTGWGKPDEAAKWR